MLNNSVLQQKDISEEKLLFWKAKLQHLSPLQLSTDFSPLPLQKSSRKTLAFTLNQHLVLALKGWIIKQDTTLFAACLSAFKVILYRYSGQQDICVGSLLEINTDEPSGSFTNTIALRTHLRDEMNFSELMQLVQKTIDEAYEYGQVPFEKVAETVEQENRSSIFQHLITWQHVPESGLPLADLQPTKPANLHPLHNSGFTFQLIETDFGIDGIIEYATDLYKQDAIERLIAHYQQFLQSFITAPDQSISTLTIITEAEKKLLLKEFSTSTIEFPKDKTIVDLFETHAEVTPDALAVVYEGKRLTYRELNIRANQVAHYLISKGVKEEMVVPICIERSLETMIGLVGILKSGAAYVPIDPAYPQERICYVLEDTKASIVVTNQASCAKLQGNEGLDLAIVDDGSLDSQPTYNPATNLCPQNLVYVIYTSGSTGKPKGAMIEHGKLLDHCYGMIANSNLRSCQSFALTFPLVFDAGHSILHSCIVLGGTLHVLSDEVLMNGEKITAYLKEREVDCMKIVSSLWISYTDEQHIALPQKVLVFGGEPFTATMHSLLAKANYNGEVYNHYGPTETSIGKCIHRVDLQKMYSNIPIGKPFGNTQLYILDRNFQPTPIGIPGELCIAGEGVGRGYLNRPELTAEKFVTNPFSTDKSARMYRTGDLARWLEDGNIECLGRVDDQVKIRGFRIELGEIESVLQQHENVRQAAIVARADAQGNKRLEAYVLYEGDFDREGLIAYLKGKLPEYMVPALWMQLERFPLTFNGKVNKKALPQIEIAYLQNKNYQAPRTAPEAGLAAIWQRLLSIEKISIDDDFFVLGGHSLLAMRVIAAVRKELACELSIQDIFAHPTIAQLATKLNHLQSNQSLLQPAKRPELLPLSYNQQSLWFIHQLEGSVQYHIPLVLRIEGNLNEKALEMALQAIINRHEVLRTVMLEIDGQTYQKILEQNQWHLNYIESNAKLSHQEPLHETISQLIQTPFDLCRDHMLRASLIKLSVNECILVLTVHHIASDEWSSSILKKELFELYQAFSVGSMALLPTLPIQYADYALWQKAYLPNVLEEKLGYWKKKLKELTPLQLPTDSPRPALQSTRGTLAQFTIDKRLLSQLKSVSQQHQVTLFMTLLAAFKVLLYRYSNQEDICVGTPVAGRDRAETEDLIGFFVNTLPVRTLFQEDMSFQELLQAVRTTTLETFEYAQIPFEKIVEAVVQERDLSRNPIFQHLFVLQNVPEASLQLADVQLTEVEHPHLTSKFDLTFQLTDTNEGMEGVVEYCTDLYKQATIERMLGHYMQLLQSIVINPLEKVNRLQLLTQAEEQLLLQTFNQTQAVYPRDKTIVDLFEQQAQQTPEAIAVIFQGTQLTYQELNEKSNQLAYYLKSKGVQRETLVPICMERSLEMVIGILGILKAGAAYVPIDPAFPKDRIEYMLSDTKATLVIGSHDTREKLLGVDEVFLLGAEQAMLDNQPKVKLSINTAPDHLCYVMYTSGSTGKPKGVMIEHHNVVNFLSSMTKDVVFTPDSSILSVTTYSFDIFYLELYLPLINGGKVILVSRETAMDGYALAQQLSLYKPTHMQATPSGWQLLLNSGWNNQEAIKLLVGGEALSDELKISLTAIGEVWNLYGPTETTIWSAVKKIEPEENVLIGKPIDNTLIYILGNQNQLNPIGVPGELCIAGEGVGRGYLNKPDLTNEKFVANPFGVENNARMYHTGDLARWLPDGNIEYVGRVDDQVKIRGFRIELGEIESVLQQHEQVKQAVVAAQNDTQGNKRLVAYIVSTEDFNREDLVAHLKSCLPEYMIPSLWMPLEKLPLTFNGKVNKKALPQVDTTEWQNKEYKAPRNNVETQLANIWQRLLGLENIGIEDDFFILGGHSLLAMRVIAAVRKELASELSIRDLFSYPTIAELATKLQPQRKPKQQTILKRDETLKLLPLSYNQQSLWFIHQLEGSVQYHIPLVLRIEGNLNEKALEMALQAIINRHEVLRTVMLEIDGHTYQKIIEPFQWQLEIINYSEFGRPVTEQTLQQEIGWLVQIPFDLSKDFMLRGSLIKIDITRQILVLTLHHIASDGWSLSILTNELIALYEAYLQEKPVSLSPLPVQYADYALWQRSNLPDILEEKLGYWKIKLKELTPLQLPTDMPRSAVQSTRGDVIRFEIELSLVEQLQMLGKWQDATLFMTLLAAFKVLLYRYSNQEDICVGTPVAGRDRAETEDLIGFFVNSLALRTQLNGEISFAHHLQAVKTTTLEAFEHAQVPFEKVVEAVVQERDLSRNPIFGHLFVLQNVPEASLQLAGAELTEQIFPHHTSKFDLTFQLTETSNGIKGIVEYCTDLYNPDTIERMVGHYKQLLHAIVSNPTQCIDTLPLLAAQEEKQLLKAFNPVNQQYPVEQTFLDMFEAYAEHMPDAVAVVFENNELTYRELNAQANQLAHLLQGKALQANTLIPICMDRSLEMIVGIVGILKAGAAYVPIDPTYPQERINYVLEDTQASLVICNQESKPLFTQHAVEIIDLTADWESIRQEPVSNLISRPAAHHLAYVIYTSGSTGKPKGVMIEHQGLAASTLARQSYYHKIESVLLIPSFAFDSSVAVIFGALSTGSKLILCRSESVKDPLQIKSLLQYTEAILCVPSYYRFLLEEKVVSDSALTKVIVAGENLDESLVDMHFTKVPHIHLYNEYGPTECTVWASVAKIERKASKVTIGKPIDNTLIYILGSQNQLNPVGVPGELCIAGKGVARGYLNRPDLTKEKFVVNPFSESSGDRMYRTGDLARWLEDGNIEYVGRIDDQVKIRGFRIELGEIESVLQQYEQIRQAAVVARADKFGHNRLVAFVIGEGNFDREKAVSFLKLKLPEHMVPRLWVEMERLPLNSNGKVNKKALPDVDTTALATSRYEAPQTFVEKVLADIWQVLLGIEKVGRYDDFFELGGNSLLAMRLHMNVKRITGTVLPLSAIFAYPKLIDFAIRLQTVSDNSKWDPLVTIQPKGSKTPIYFIHDAFGDIEYAYRLATFLGDQHPMYGLLGLGTNGIDTPLNSMDALVDFHVNRLLAHQPEGPYHLVSYSLGGNLVHAMACRLAAMRKKVGLVVIFDAYPINHSRFTYRRIGLSYVLRSVANFFQSKDISFRYKWETVFTEVPELIRFNMFRLKSRFREEKIKGSHEKQKNIEPREKIYLGLKQATDNYKVQPFPGVILFFRAKENTAKYLLHSDFGWKYYAEGGIHVYDLPGIHRAILREKTTIEYVAKTLITHFNWFEQIRS